MTRFALDTRNTPTLFQITMEDEKGQLLAHYQIPLTNDDLARLWLCVYGARPAKD